MPPDLEYLEITFLSLVSSLSNLCQSLWIKTTLLPLSSLLSAVAKGKAKKPCEKAVLFGAILSFYIGQKWVKIFTNRSGQAEGG